MFFTAFALCVLRLPNFRTEAKQYTEILIAKLQNSNQNFAYPLQAYLVISTKLKM